MGKSVEGNHINSVRAREEASLWKISPEVVSEIQTAIRDLDETSIYTKDLLSAEATNALAQAGLYLNQPPLESYPPDSIELTMTGSDGKVFFKNVRPREDVVRILKELAPKNPSQETSRESQAEGEIEVPVVARHIDISGIIVPDSVREVITALEKNRGIGEKIEDEILECFYGLGFEVETPTESIIRISKEGTNGEVESAVMHRGEAVAFLKTLFTPRGTQLVPRAGSYTRTHMEGEDVEVSSKRLSLENGFDDVEVVGEVHDLHASESVKDDVIHEGLAYPENRIGEEDFERSIVGDSAPVEEGTMFSIAEAIGPDVIDQKIIQEKLKNESEAGVRESFFDTRFESEFGLTKENLKTIPGFERLSAPQQKLIFENLAEYAESAQKPFLGKVWEGIKEAVGVVSEKNRVKAGSGMEAYGTVVTQLIRSFAFRGPKVHEEDGMLIPAFIDIDLKGKREARPKIREAVVALNLVAGILAKTPASWQEDGIGTHAEEESRLISFIKNRFSERHKNYLEYTKRQGIYDRAKKTLSQVLVESGYTEVEIALKLLTVDRQVFETQFIQTSPDAVEVIEKIPDQSFLKSVGKSLVQKSNLAHMALGYVGRAATVGVLEFFATPLVSASLAGAKAFNTTEAELRERDRAARMGNEDTSEESLNIVNVEKIVEKDGITYDIGLVQKLQNLIDRFHVAYSNGDVSEEAKLIASIKARISYIEGKQKLNRINFGDIGTRPALYGKLYTALGQAHMVVGDYETVLTTDGANRSISQRVEKIVGALDTNLTKREQEIQKKRRLLQTKKVAWNAFRAGAFSLAGAWISDYVRSGLVESVTEQAPATSSVPVSESVLPEPEVPTSNPSIDVQPMDAMLEPHIPLEPHTIQPRDTLTKIIRESIPSIRDIGRGQSQETAIENILLRLSPEDVKKIGIVSGDMNRLRLGAKIDLEALNTIIEARKK